MSRRRHSNPGQISLFHHIEAQLPRGRGDRIRPKVRFNESQSSDREQGAAKVRGELLARADGMYLYFEQQAEKRYGVPKAKFSVLYNDIIGVMLKEAFVEDEHDPAWQDQQAETERIRAEKRARGELPEPRWGLIPFGGGPRLSAADWEAGLG